MTAGTGEAVELVGGIDFGEGLRWHDGRLWYSDFFQHTVYAVALDGTREAMLTIDDQPSGLGWLPDGRLLVVSMLDRTVLRVEADGTVVTHADLGGFATGPCNDLVVGASGHAYVGNFGYDLWAGEPLVPADLVRIAPDGHAEVAATELVFPNGSVITPDGSTLIVGETLARIYTAFTIGPDGALSDRRVWATLDGVSPDGCVLDAEGGIWTANPSAGHDGGPGEVVRVVEGGAITHRIAVPQTAYACTLGGPDGTTLFATTAPGAMHGDVGGKGLGVIYTAEVDVPHAGRP